MIAKPGVTHIDLAVANLIPTGYTVIGVLPYFLLTARHVCLLSAHMYATTVVIQAQNAGTTDLTIDNGKIRLIMVK